MRKSALFLEMNGGSEGTSPATRTLERLCRGFDALDDVAASREWVDPAEVPPPFDRLLVHRNHMTTTLRDYYHEALVLDVLQHRLHGSIYTREILLRLERTERVVELGIARIHLDRMPAGVRQAVLERRTPLGDILIRHDVMREIRPRGFLKLPLSSGIRHYLQGASEGTQVYGRIGVIEVNRVPAIEVLEIVTNGNPSFPGPAPNERG